MTGKLKCLIAQDVLVVIQEKFAHSMKLWSCCYSMFQNQPIISHSLYELLCLRCSLQATVTSCSMCVRSLPHIFKYRPYKRTWLWDASGCMFMLLPLLLKGHWEPPCCPFSLAWALSTASVTAAAMQSNQKRVRCSIDEVKAPTRARVLTGSLELIWWRLQKEDILGLKPEKMQNYLALIYWRLEQKGGTFFSLRK